MYVPADPPRLVVFAGDGQTISRWGSVLETVGAPSTVIVGVHGSDDESLRLSEYSPVFDAERFAAHEEFFVNDVRGWLSSHLGVALPAARTAVFGYSAGAELALALGIRHPEIFGAVIAGSPGGGYKPKDVLPEPLPRFYLFAGTLEPFFQENMTRWADALRDSGAAVTINERELAHGAHAWRAEFPCMVSWMLPE